MPRRYRPPTRRRKSKKDRLPAEGEAPTYEAAPGIAPAPRAPVPPPAPPRERASEVRHIARDHSYVLGEIRRSGILVAFIIGGLVITAILRSRPS